MKKSFLALVLPTLFAFNSAQAYEVFNNDTGSLEVYGQLRAKMTKLENKDVTLDDGGSRAGINAAYQVNDDFKALATVEYSISSDTLANRLSYFGVSGDFGTVYFGKQYNTASDLWGPSEGYFYGGSLIPQGALSGGKLDSSIRYIYNGDHGFWFDTTYGFSEGTEGVDTNPEVIDVYAGVSLAGFDLTFGVAHEKQEGWGTGNALNVEDLFRTAWVYKTIGDVTLGLGYADSTFKNQDGAEEIKRNATTASLTYSLSPEILIYGGYDHAEYDSNFNLSTAAGENVENSGSASAAYLGGHYKFNQYFRVYGEMAHYDGAALGFQNSQSDIRVSTPFSATNEMLYAIGARVYW